MSDAASEMAVDADTDKLRYCILPGDAWLNMLDFCITILADCIDSFAELVDNDPALLALVSPSTTVEPADAA
jgi:hypothetical protein